MISTAKVPGTELAVTWQPWDWWRVRANYSFLDLELHTRGPIPSVGEGDEGVDPEHPSEALVGYRPGAPRGMGFGMALREPRAIHRRPKLHGTRHAAGVEADAALRAGHRGPQLARGTSSPVRALRDHRSECRGGPNGVRQADFAVLRKSWLDDPPSGVRLPTLELCQHSRPVRPAKSIFAARMSWRPCKLKCLSLSERADRPHPGEGARGVGGRPSDGQAGEGIRLLLRRGAGDRIWRMRREKSFPTSRSTSWARSSTTRK